MASMRPPYIYPSTSSAEEQREENTRGSSESDKRDANDDVDAPSQIVPTLIKQVAPSPYWDVPTILSSWPPNPAYQQDVRSLLDQFAKNDAHFPIFIDTAAYSAQGQNGGISGNTPASFTGTVLPSLPHSDNLPERQPPRSGQQFGHSDQRLAVPADLRPFYTPYGLRKSPQHSVSFPSPQAKTPESSPAKTKYLSEPKPTESASDSKLLGIGETFVKPGRSPGNKPSRSLSDSEAELSELSRVSCVDNTASDLGKAADGEKLVAADGDQKITKSPSRKRAKSESPQRSPKAVPLSTEQKDCSDPLVVVETREPTSSSRASSPASSLHPVLDPLSLKKRYSQLLAPVPNYSRSAEIAKALRRVPRVKVKPSCQRFGPQRRSRRILASKVVKSAPRRGYITKESPNPSSVQDSDSRRDTQPKTVATTSKKSPRLALKREKTFANAKASTLASVKKAAAFESSAVAVKKPVTATSPKAAFKSGKTAKRRLIVPQEVVKAHPSHVTNFGVIRECRVKLKRLSPKVVEQWSSKKTFGEQSGSSTMDTSQDSSAERTKEERSAASVKSSSLSGQGEKPSELRLGNTNTTSETGQPTSKQPPPSSSVSSGVASLSKSDDRPTSVQKKAAFKKSSIFINRFLREHPNAIPQPPLWDAGKPGAFSKAGRAKKGSPLGRSSFTRRKPPRKSLTDFSRSPLREAGSPSRVSSSASPRAHPPSNLASPTRDVRQSPLAYMDNYSEKFPVNTTQEKPAVAQSNPSPAGSQGPLSPGSAVTTSEAANAIIHNLQKIVAQKSPLRPSDKSPDRCKKSLPDGPALQDASQTVPAETASQNTNVTVEHNKSSEEAADCSTKEVSYSDWLAQISGPSGETVSQNSFQEQTVSKSDSTPKHVSAKKAPAQSRQISPVRAKRTRIKRVTDKEPVVQTSETTASVNSEAALNSASSQSSPKPNSRSKRKSSVGLPTLNVSDEIDDLKDQEPYTDPSLPELSKVELSKVKKKSKATDIVDTDIALEKDPPQLDLAPDSKESTDDHGMKKKKSTPRQRKSVKVEKEGVVRTPASSVDASAAGPAASAAAASAAAVAASKEDDGVSVGSGHLTEKPSTDSPSSLEPSEQQFSENGDRRESSGSISSDCPDSPTKDPSRKRKSGGYAPKLYRLRSLAPVLDDEEALKKALELSLLDAETKPELKAVDNAPSGQISEVQDSGSVPFSSLEKTSSANHSVLQKKLSNHSENAQALNSETTNSDQAVNCLENQNQEGCDGAKPPDTRLMEQFAIRPSIVSLPWLTNTDIAKIQKDTDPVDSSAAKKLKIDLEAAMAGDSIVNGQMDHASRRKGKPRKISRGLPLHTSPPPPPSTEKVEKDGSSAQRLSPNEIPVSSQNLAESQAMSDGSTGTCNEPVGPRTRNSSGSSYADVFNMFLKNKASESDSESKRSRSSSPEKAKEKSKATASTPQAKTDSSSEQRQKSDSASVKNRSSVSPSKSDHGNNSDSGQWGTRYSPRMHPRVARKDMPRVPKTHELPKRLPSPPLPLPPPAAVDTIAKPEDTPSPSKAYVRPRFARVARKDMPRLKPPAAPKPPLEAFPESESGAKQKQSKPDTPVVSDLPTDFASSGTKKDGNAKVSPVARFPRVARKDMRNCQSKKNIADNSKASLNMKHLPANETVPEDLSIETAKPKSAQLDFKDTPKQNNLNETSELELKAIDAKGDVTPAKPPKAEADEASGATNNKAVEATPPKSVHVPRVARKDMSTLQKSKQAKSPAREAPETSPSQPLIDVNASRTVGNLPQAASPEKPFRFGRVARKDMPIKKKKKQQVEKLDTAATITSDDIPKPSLEERRQLPSRRSKVIAEERLKSQSEDTMKPDFTDLVTPSMPELLGLQSTHISKKPAPSTILAKSPADTDVLPQPKVSNASDSINVSEKCEQPLKIVDKDTGIKDMNSTAQHQKVVSPANIAKQPASEKTLLLKSLVEKDKPISKPVSKPTVVTPVETSAAALLLTNDTSAAKGPVIPVVDAITKMPPPKASAKSYARASKSLKATGNKTGLRSPDPPAAIHTKVDVFDFDQNEEEEKKAPEHVKLNRPILTALMENPAIGGNAHQKNLLTPPIAKTVKGGNNASIVAPKVQVSTPETNSGKQASKLAERPSRKSKLAAQGKLKEPEVEELPPKPAWVYKPFNWPQAQLPPNTAMPSLTESSHLPVQQNFLGANFLPVAAKGMRGRHKRTKSECGIVEPKDNHTVEDFLRIMAPKAVARENVWPGTECFGRNYVGTDDTDTNEEEVTAAPVSFSGRAQRRSKLIAQQKLKQTRKAEEEADLPAFPSEWMTQPRFALPPDVRYSPPTFDPETLPSQPHNPETLPSRRHSVPTPAARSHAAAPPIKLKINLVKSGDGKWVAKKGKAATKQQTLRKKRQKAFSVGATTEARAASIALDPYDPAHSDHDESSDDEGPFGVSASESETETAEPPPCIAKKAQGSTFPQPQSHERSFVAAPTPSFPSNAPQTNSGKGKLLQSPPVLTASEAPLPGASKTRPDKHDLAVMPTLSPPYNPHTTNISSPEPTPVGKKQKRQHSGTDESFASLMLPQYQLPSTNPPKQRKKRQSSSHSHTSDSSALTSPGAYTRGHWPIEFPDGDLQSQMVSQIKASSITSAASNLAGGQERRLSAGSSGSVWSKHSESNQSWQAKSPAMHYEGVKHQGRRPSVITANTSPPCAPPLMSPTPHKQELGQDVFNVNNDMKKKKGKRSSGSSQQPPPQKHSKASLADQIYAFPSDSPETLKTKRPRKSIPEAVVSPTAHRTGLFTRQPPMQSWKHNSKPSTEIHGSTTMTPETDSSDVLEAPSRKNRRTKQNSDSSDFSLADSIDHRNSSGFHMGPEQSPFSDVTPGGYSSKASLDLNSDHGMGLKGGSHDLDTPPSLSSFADTPLSSESLYPPQLQPNLGAMQPPSLTTQGHAQDPKMMLRNVSRMMANTNKQDMQRHVAGIGALNDSPSPGPPLLEPVDNQQSLADKEDLIPDVFSLDDFLDPPFNSLSSASRFGPMDRKGPFDDSRPGPLTAFNIEEILQSAERDLVPSAEQVPQFTSHPQSTPTYTAPTVGGRDDSFLSNTDNIMETINPNLIYTKDQNSAADSLFGSPGLTAQSSGLPNFGTAFLQPASCGTPQGASSSGLLEDSDESDNGMDRLLSQPSVRFRGPDEKAHSPSSQSGATGDQESSGALGADFAPGGIMDSLWATNPQMDSSHSQVSRKLVTSATTLPKGSISHSKTAGVVRETKPAPHRRGVHEPVAATVGGAHHVQNFAGPEIVSSNMGIITCHCGAAFTNNAEYQLHEAFCPDCRF